MAGRCRPGLWSLGMGGAIPQPSSRRSPAEKGGWPRSVRHRTLHLDQGGPVRLHHVRTKVVVVMLPRSTAPLSGMSEMLGMADATAGRTN